MRRLLIATSVLLCLSCAHQPDAEAIRGAIGEAAAAVEARRGADLLEHVSEDFIGNDELDRAQLDRMLRMQMMGAKSIGVSVDGIHVDVQGDRATASFEANITDSSGRWIPDRAVTLKFESGWRHGKMQIKTENIYASMYSAMGIDWKKEITNTPSKRAYRYVDALGATEFLADDEIAELFV